jgi:hypothetical protein
MKRAIPILNSQLIKFKMQVFCSKQTRIQVRIYIHIHHLTKIQASRMLVFFNSLKNPNSKLYRLIFTIKTLVNKEEVNLEIQVKEVVNH